MVKKKKKKEDIPKEKYLSNPNFSKLKKYVKENKNSRFKTELIKKAYKKKVSYEKQKAEIKAGFKPTKFKTESKKLINAAIKNIMKKKILKKPTAKLPVYSATKFIAKIANPNDLVRDVPNPYVDPVQDNRSLFFKESYLTEKRKRFGGFI